MSTKGYQYQWYRYHWEGIDLSEDLSEWVMVPLLYKTLDEAKDAALGHAIEERTQVQVLRFDGDDWHYEWGDQVPDFDGEREYFGSWSQKENDR